MSTIIPAGIEHVSFIANQLVYQYADLNQKIGHNIYKTDLQLFSQIVESRIRDINSEFKYFILTKEDGELLGFISLLQKIRGEILMLGLKNKNKANLESLLSFGVEFLKENGSTSIVFETAPDEKEYKELITNLGAQQFSSKFILG